MDKNNKKIIEETVVELLNKMGFDYKVDIAEVEMSEDDYVICNIKVEGEADFIIGQNGDTLQALQHLARLLVRKKTEDIVKFVLDVNSYKKGQELSVIELAQEMAQKAVAEKRIIVLTPMSAYDRRLVHMHLSENKDITTESTGDRDERRVVIKPVDLN